MGLIGHELHREILFSLLICYEIDEATTFNIYLEIAMGIFYKLKMVPLP